MLKTLILKFLKIIINFEAKFFNKPVTYLPYQYNLLNQYIVCFHSKDYFIKNLMVWKWS